METARCKAFLAAAETGSFTHAAEQLHYTPSGVSQLVNALERELNLTLLRRSKRGVSVTTDGEALLPVVREFLRQEDRLYQIAGELNHLLTGTLRIYSYSSLATHWLPPVIGAFHNQYPQVTLRMREGTRNQAEEWINQNIVDLAFYSYTDGIRHDWFPIAEVPILAVLPRSHPLADAPAYPLKNCSEESLILYSLGQDDDINNMLRDNHIHANVALTTLENYSALAMVEQNLGITLINQIAAQSCPFDVVQLPLDPPQYITVGIAVPSYHSATPAVREFVQFAMKRLRTAAQSQPLK